MESPNVTQTKEGGCRSLAAALEQQDDASRPNPVVLSVPWEKTNDQDKLAVLLPDILSESECNKIIEACEGYGFEQALMNGGRGSQYLNTDKRKSGRCIVDVVEAADVLFDRLKHVLPEYVTQTNTKGSNAKSYRLVGLNERFRTLKYEPGDYFKRHRDGSFTRSPGDPRGPGDTSFFTVMFYLNTPKCGGETNFADYDRNFLHNPSLQGQALVFDHGIMHESAELREGVKYAIRTDVMYRKLPVDASLNVKNKYSFGNQHRVRRKKKGHKGGGDNGGSKPCRLPGHGNHSWKSCRNNPKSQNFNGVHYQSLDKQSESLLDKTVLSTQQDES